MPRKIPTIKNTAKQLGVIKECAQIAGIEHAMTLAFGTLLGCVREKRIIPHDDDTDVGILADLITKEQEDVFVDCLKKRGLFDAREKRRYRGDTGRILWCSLRTDKYPLYLKSCIWFMYRWNGYIWHTKGVDWVGKIGVKRELADIKTCVAVAKGNTARYYDHLIKKRFYDDDYYIPLEYGSILREWYGNFMIPKEGGCSTLMTACIIHDWSKPNKWEIVNIK